MGGTGIAVILIFLVTMLSSMGTNNSHYPPSSAPVEMNMNINIPSGYSASINPQTDYAVHKYVTVHAKKLNFEDAKLVGDYIMKYSAQYDVNPRIVSSLIHRESGFDPRSVSSSNAQGLAQLLPSTASGIGITDPFDLEQGVKGAAMYIRMMMDRWPGNPDRIALGLASYAEGPNQIARAGGKCTDATKRYIRDIITDANTID